MSPVLIIDIIILAVLLIFALLGAKKGLVLTLCGLVAVLVAFVGASFLANLLAPRVTAVLEPHFVSAIESSLTDRIAEQEPALPEESAEQTPLFDLLGVLRSAGIYQNVLNAIDEAVDSGISAAITAASTAAGAALARTVAYILVFAVSFLLVLIAWFILSHALDLACKLPVLHTLNTTGGLLIGLVKGAILLFIAAWVARHLGIGLPDGAVEQTYLLRFFMTTNPITLITGI